MKRLAPHLIAVLACPLLALSSPAHAAPPQAQSCVSINRDAARLACYDKAMGRTVKKTIAAAQVTPAKAPPAVPAHTVKSAEAAPALPGAQTTKAQFGSEKLKAPAGTRQEKKVLDKITGVIRSHTMNTFGKFTITLENGQVWKQDQGDSSGRPAYFPHRGNVHVTISRGLLGSYNLSIEGSDLVYKVERIK